MTTEIEQFLQRVEERNPGQTEFLQAVHEVTESVWPVFNEFPEFRKAKILERIVEPERQVMFRVAWQNDKGEVEVNRGFRIQMNSAIGPYKGGLRFHPSVNISILKFLAFEQVFKNSLTTLSMGGGKGGSDFNPRGRSDSEVMRFCQAFMTELFRHIGANTDVPAGDIGVGGREIGYLFGQYKRLSNRFEGVLTGKGQNWGGSLIRPEATGYGAVFFGAEMLATRDQNFEGKVAAVSGSGNVAQHAVEKLIALGAKVVTLSDSDGFIYDRDGIDEEKLAFVKDLKNNKRGRIREYVDKFGGAEYHEAKADSNCNPLWDVKVDAAFPCATQNELNGTDADNLINNGCKLIVEGANMPSTDDAIARIRNSDALFAPGKAANAGGVATSGLEMAQNSIRLSWSADEVESRLKAIMVDIHKNCRETAERFGDADNYVDGANIAGFLKVANAMLDQGVL